MMPSLLVLSMLSAKDTLPEWQQSKMSGISNLVIAGCVTPIPDSRLKDYCYIDKMTTAYCDINMHLGEKCD